MSINPLESNTLSYAPTDKTLPRPIGYEPRLGVLDEPARLDHVHPIFVENWHYVEDSELRNGWNNPADFHQIFRFLRDPMGFVHLEGKLDAGTTAVGTSIYYLPIGYRPANTLRFAAPHNHGTAIASIVIYNTGQIALGMPVSNNLFFNGVSFEADRNQVDSFIL